MNRIAKFLTIATLALASTAYAAEEKKAAKADAAKGEAIFNAGVPAANVPACMSCHGANGNSGGAANPKLAGQHADYIAKQLKDFKEKKDRNNAVMSPYSAALSDQDMRDIGAYLAKQTQKPASAKNKATIEQGQKIYRGGIASKEVPACAGCHSPNGAGIPAQFPRIGGQFAEYTEAQLLAFKAGQRKNSPQMTAIAAKMTDAEIKAVADYAAGIR